MPPHDQRGHPPFLNISFRTLEIIYSLSGETNTTATPSLAELESEVELRSAGLKKQLGLFDLVLTQVVFVVGTIWVGWAAKLGSQQGFFWILAILTFYLPLAAVVIFLNRLMPLEG